MVIVEAVGHGSTSLCANATEETLDPSKVERLPGLTARWIGWVQRRHEWIAGQIPVVLASLEPILSTGSTNRARVLKNYAVQSLTLRAFGNFLEDEAGIPGVATELHLRSLEVHADHANAQLGLVVEQAAGPQFLEGLLAVLKGGKYLRLVTETTGYGENPFPDGQASAEIGGTYSAGDTVKIWPEIALQVVQQHLSRGGGQRLEFSRNAILQQLKQEGLLAGNPRRGREHSQTRERVWEIKTAVLLRAAWD